MAAAVAVVVLAGGSGTRVGAGRNKVYLPLGGRPVIARSLEVLGGLPGVGPVVLVVREEDRDLADRVVAAEVDVPGVEVVTGGATRQGSELAALRALAGRIRAGAVDVVLVHDGARPLVTADLAGAVVRAAREHGGAVPGLPRTDLAAAGPDGLVPAPAPLVAVQTPQGFRAGPLLEAYERADREGFAGTDTASCVARFAPGVAVVVVPGDPRNVKITWAHDLVAVERALAGPAPGRP